MTVITSFSYQYPYAELTATFNDQPDDVPSLQLTLTAIDQEDQVVLWESSIKPGVRQYADILNHGGSVTAMIMRLLDYEMVVNQVPMEIDKVASTFYRIKPRDMGAVDALVETSRLSLLSALHVNVPLAMSMRRRQVVH